MKLPMIVGHAATAPAARERVTHHVRLGEDIYVATTTPDGPGHWYRCEEIVGWAEGSREDAIASLRILLARAA